MHGLISIKSPLCFKLLVLHLLFNIAFPKDVVNVTMRTVRMCTPGRSREQLSIQYMSDLHLERISYQYDILKAVPILILGGDIGCFCDYDRYCGFLSRICG